MAERSRSFGPLVLLGLGSGVLTAVAGNKVWATSSGDRQAVEATAGFLDYDAHLPAVTALALVVLACWGVLLVSRGRFRRLVAFLGAVAALGTLVAAVLGILRIPDSLRDAFAALGYPDISVGLTTWAWVGVVGSVLVAAASVSAVRLVGSWPEMGSKYDAPGAADEESSTAAAPEEQSNLDLWKAMDEGRDPTA